MTSKSVLVTGGTGYIGSHTVIELLNSNYEVTIIDNLSNSKIEAITRIEKITGKTCNFKEVDICDKNALESIFSEKKFHSVMHFAGLKSVSESESSPMSYYKTNVAGSVNLIETMINHQVSNLVFSSSATVYGDPSISKCVETSPQNPVNFYGKTKLFAEEIICSVAKVNLNFTFAILRYFNPVGAHKSGLIGEDPNGIPNNLMPFITQVAVGKRKELQIWGNDYSTPDGTGKRDYIHVEDLASGHLAALSYLNSGGESVILNLGTGISHSVLEVIEAFKKASGKEIPFVFAKRRPGDVAENYADPSKAKQILGWSTKYDIHQMCEDSWRWQSLNPNGYV